MSVLSAERRSAGECVVRGAGDARGVTAGGVDCGGCGGVAWFAGCVDCGMCGGGGAWRRGLQPRTQD